MAQILKFPAQASKLGYKRVRRHGRSAETEDQLRLFSEPSAQILEFAFGLSSFERALMLDERGNPKAAAEFYTRAIAEHECVADAFCNLGIIESQNGNRAKAYDCFTTCLQHEPRHSEAHYNLGNLYFDANDFRLAQFHYELAAQLEPSFANVWFNLALVQAINDDFASALVALNKYQALAPEGDGQIAEEVLQNLKKSLASAKNSRLGPS